MASGKITKRLVDAIQHGEKDQFIWDEELRGFGLKVARGGKRTYIFQYRMGGRATATKRVTIGTHGSPWTPASARAEAERIALDVGRGIDPVEARKQAELTASQLDFVDYLDTFSKHYLQIEGGRSWRQTKRQLEMHVLPRLRGRTLLSLKKGDINGVIDPLRERPGLARNTWAALSRMLSWAVERGDIEVSPMATMKPPVGAASRDRVLSEVELLALWRATYRLNQPFGPLVRLLILTIQRRGEVAGLGWAELSRAGAEWSIPGHRAKNGIDHIVPLSKLAMSELETLGWQGSGFVFSTTGDTSVSGFSKTKKALDAAFALELALLRGLSVQEMADTPPEPWRIHDIRRTGATGLQALGVPIEVTERVLNHHQGGTLAGITKVYQRHDYKAEKRAALDKWSGWIEKLVQPDRTVSGASSVECDQEPTYLSFYET